jgi:imidazolonepropionase-like amidohydrolase
MIRRDESKPMSSENDLTLVNCSILDVRTGELADGQSLRIVGNRIREISTERPGVDRDVLDLAGKTVIPGLIEGHGHVMASDINLPALARETSTLLTLRAIPILRNLLMRGFTSLRDAGGADYGLAEGVETGLIQGPRLFISGKGIAQTGGQGDFRERRETDLPDYCSHSLGPLSRVADGVDAVRHAVREELRRGAKQIKIFGGGGIAGGVPLEYSHYSVEELRAACDEAAAFGTYVMAHAYSPDSILRAVDAGVRTIEHGNLIDEAVAEKIRDRAYIVPTLSGLEGRLLHADELGMPARVRKRTREVIDQGLSGIEMCHRVGLPVGFGTDLEGITHQYLMLEFELRSRVESPLQVLQSATVVNAEILQMEGQLGVVDVGALADLLIVDGNPAEDINVLLDAGRLLGVIKDGEVVRYEL